MDGKIELETVSAVLRYHKNREAKYGEPPDLAMTVSFAGREEIFLSGLVDQERSGNAFTQSVWRDIVEWAGTQGIKRIKFVRYKNGIVRPVTVRVK